MAVTKFTILSGIYLLILGLTAGCLPIPVPPHGMGVVPDRNAVDSFSPELTRRRDIVLKLGEPKYRLEGDRFLMYEWDVAYGYLLFGGPGAGAILPVVAPHYLCFEFGPDGRLIRKEELVGSIYSKPDRAIAKCTNPSENIDATSDK